MPRKKVRSSKIYVLDSNIFLDKPQALLSYKENDLVFPFTWFDVLNSHYDLDAGEISVMWHLSIFLQTTATLRRKALVLYKSIINISSSIYQFNVSSRLSRGECYV